MAPTDNRIVASLAPPPPFVFSGVDILRRWKRWESAWTSYELASGLKSLSQEVRIATLKTVVGLEGIEMRFEDEENSEVV
jgi:hypothetical protein